MFGKEKSRVFFKNALFPLRLKINVLMSGVDQFTRERVNQFSHRACVQKSSSCFVALKVATKDYY